jgi:hypothetical protein
MTAIPEDIKENAHELAKFQGIYFTKSGDYGFPLFQVNNYEGGQLFMLTEIDGKPFTENLFSNLFQAYSDETEFQYLLRGKTAKYKVVPRQGIDKIQPNAFSNKIGQELREKVIGARSLTSRKNKFQQTLPAEAVVHMEGHTISVRSKKDAEQVAGNIFVKDGVKMTVKREPLRYSTNSSPSNRGKVFFNKKPIADLKELDRFANRMGYINWSSFRDDAANRDFINGAKNRNEIYLLSFTAEKVETPTMAEFGEEPPAGPDTETDNPFQC